MAEGACYYTACGTIVPQLGIKSTPLALEERVLTTDCQGSPPRNKFLTVHWRGVVQLPWRWSSHRPSWRVTAQRTRGTGAGGEGGAKPA